MSSAGSTAAAPLSEAERRRILARLEHGIAPVTAPFANIAADLNIDEDTVIAVARDALASGLLSRFGPMFNLERMGGTFALCALQVPADRFALVAETVNAFPEVAHNYAREGDWNMWFVLALAKADDLTDTVAAIESATGLTVLMLPKLKEYRLDLRLIE